MPGIRDWRERLSLFFIFLPLFFCRSGLVSFARERESEGMDACVNVLAVDEPVLFLFRAVWALGNGYG